MYIDDILICSENFEDHISHLKLVLERLRCQANLKLKIRKCAFLCQKVNYLGHVISCQGIAPDPAKTEKVREYPVPTDLTKLCQFLGLNCLVSSQVYSGGLSAVETVAVHFTSIGLSQIRTRH